MDRDGRKKGRRNRKGRERNGGRERERKQESRSDEGQEIMAMHVKITCCDQT